MGYGWVLDIPVYFDLRDPWFWLLVSPSGLMGLVLVGEQLVFLFGTRRDHY